MDIDPAEDRKDFLLVICLERFWPAHGGVERYALEIARWFQKRGSVVVVTAVRQNRSLRDELIGRRDSFMESSAEIGGLRILTTGLGRASQLWFKTLTSLEDVVHRISRRQYYHTRWMVMQETARLLAIGASGVLDSVHRSHVILHAMGPWELSHVGDRLFPNAARVATPFIHPGYWGEDSFSQGWFRSRDGLVALGDEDAKACISAASSPDRVTIVPLFAPATIESTVPVESRRTVVFLGVARSYKGVDIFLKAVKIVQAVRRDLRFIWAGSIPTESGDFQEMAIGNGVQVLGPVSEEQKWEILGQALCLCLPSATEITPYSILEAWTAGASVIATNTPYLLEFVGAGGDLVPREVDAFAAAIRRLAEQPDLAEQRVRAGRSYLLKRHHASVVGPRLTTAYQEAMSRKRERISGGDGRSLSIKR